MCTQSKMATEEDGGSSGSSWQTYFCRQLTEHSGYCESLADAEELIRDYCSASHTSYVFVKSKGSLVSRAKGNQTDQGVKHEEAGHKVYFDYGLARTRDVTSIPSDGVPFMVTGMLEYACHHGMQRSAKQGGKQENADHAYRTTAAIGTKKLGCKSGIHIKHLVRFPEYKIDDSVERRRKTASQKLRHDLGSREKSDQIVRENKFWVGIIPEHEGHLVSQSADLVAPINKQLTAHVQQLVASNITDVSEVLGHLRLKTRELFLGQAEPDRFNRRFYPTRKDVSDLVYRAKKSIRKGETDLSSVNAYCERNPAFHIRMPAESQTLLIVHQEEWQKRLLARYGNTMTFLDGTYKTTRYTVPLYLVVVKTNVGYVPAASFVIQHEDTTSIQEAIATIAQKNPQWSPTAVMIDGDEKEEKAIRDVFPDASLYLCDFHVRQSWKRWTSAYRNGCVQDADVIMKMLTAIAESISEDEYQENVSFLTCSEQWHGNAQLSRYISQEWLVGDRPKMWVWKDRPLTAMFEVNTNNGVEAMNNKLKNTYIRKTGVSSLLELLKTISEQYLPDTERWYKEENLKLSGLWRKPSPDLPEFFHGRPQIFLDSIKASFAASQHISRETITDSGEGMFTIHGEGTYAIKVNEPESVPTCTCRDFQRKRRMCKHIIALFVHGLWTWDQLPASYRDSVFLNTDREVLADDISHSALEKATSVTCSQEHDIAAEDMTLVEAAQMVRNVLSHIRSLTYSTTSVTSLVRAHFVLEGVEQQLLREHPSDGGLEIGQTPMKRKAEDRDGNAKKRVCADSTIDTHVARNRRRRALKRARQAKGLVQGIADVSVEPETEMEVAAAITVEPEIAAPVGCQTDVSCLEPEVAAAITVEPEIAAPVGCQTDVSCLEPEVAAAITVEPEIAAPVGCQTDVSCLEPEVAAAITVEPEIAAPVGCHTEMSGLEPEVAAAVTVEPEIAAPVGCQTEMSCPEPEVAAAVTVEPEIAAPVGCQTEMSCREPEVAAAITVEPEIAAPVGCQTDVSCLEPEVAAAITVEPEIAAPVADQPEVQPEVPVPMVGITRKIDLDYILRTLREHPLPVVRSVGDVERYANNPSMSLCNESSMKEAAFEETFDQVMDITNGQTPGVDINRMVSCNTHIVAAALLMKAQDWGLSPLECLPTLDVIPFQKALPSGVLSVRPPTKKKSWAVGGFSLSNSSMATLAPGGKVDDQVIHAYLSTLAEDRPSVMILPSFIMTILEEGHGDTSVFHYPEEKMAEKDLLLLPVNTQDHWFLLVAWPKKGSFSLLDSLESIASGSRQEHYSSLWREYMRQRGLSTGETMCRWEFVPVITSKQEDSHSCGIFTMMYAEAVVKNNPPVLYRQCHTEPYRSWVLHTLKVKAKVNRDVVCNMPHCSSPTGEVTWVQCDECKRWLHLLCVGLGTVSADDSFRCLLCPVTSKDEQPE